MTLIIGSIIFYESYITYQREIESSILQTKNMTNVLSKELTLVLEKTDYALLDLQENLTSTKGVISAKNSKTYQQLLIQQRNKIQEVLSFKIIDKNGELVGDDIDHFKKVNYSDREYFIKLKSQHFNQIIFSHPVVSKTISSWVAVLGRPIFDTNNQFDGAVIATIDLNWFKQLFLNIKMGNKGSIALHDINDVSYFKIPWDEKSIGAKLNSPPQIISFQESYEKSFSGLLDYSNETKIVSSEKLENDFLIIHAEHPLNEVLWSWKIRTSMYILLLVFFSIAFFVLLVNFLISVDDLAEQQKLSVQNAKLASIGEMTASIAHEINNPLMIIAGQTRTIERALIDQDPEKFDKISIAVTKTKLTISRITHIIKGLKAFSHEDYNEPWELVPVKAILDHAIEACQESYNLSNINFSINVFSDLRIECREIQLEQVFINLLTNSLDAVAILDEKWVKIKVTDMSDRVRIIFQDSGKGVPPDVQDKIMTPFFTTKEIGKGTGLGLSISQGIIRNHQGLFYLDVKNPNTTFIIELPKKIDKNALVRID